MHINYATGRENNYNLVRSEERRNTFVPTRQPSVGWCQCSLMSGVLSFLLSILLSPSCSHDSMFVLEYISFIDSYQRRHKNVWWSCWCQLHAPFSPCLSFHLSACAVGMTRCGLGSEARWRRVIWIMNKKKGFFSTTKNWGEGGRPFFFKKNFRTFLLFRLELIFVCALFTPQTSAVLPCHLKQPS